MISYTIFSRDLGERTVYTNDDLCGLFVDTRDGLRQTHGTCDIIFRSEESFRRYFVANPAKCRREISRLKTQMESAYKKREEYYPYDEKRADAWLRRAWDYQDRIEALEARLEVAQYHLAHGGKL